MLFKNIFYFIYFEIPKKYKIWKWYDKTDEKFINEKLIFESFKKLGQNFLEQ